MKCRCMIFLDLIQVVCLSIKLDVVSDGLLHNQLPHFCQNARMAFLARNTPTPLLSEFMAQVNDTIVFA